ncbi:MAG: hypothetical protein PPHEMADMSA_6187 [uncultured Paraburkholderia sp.]|nr:MAG: hypothetical protein PPHEMADMSA_6187 [uncultured Paraburkholderia sp.]
MGEHFAVLSVQVPGTKISTPVRQLDFFYFYCVGKLGRARCIRQSGLVRRNALRSRHALQSGQ